MKCRSTQWILWGIAMIVFTALASSGQNEGLGLAIAVVAVRLVCRCAAHSTPGDNRSKQRIEMTEQAAGNLVEDLSQR